MSESWAFDASAGIRLPPFKPLRCRCSDAKEYVTCRCGPHCYHAGNQESLAAQDIAVHEWEESMKQRSRK